MAAEPFVSHAVNLEDVVLWRALRDVANGFYIDVGASWPTHGSVTLAFSERGWSGINIEPDPEPFADLARERPRDVNLNVAVSNTSGELPMFFVLDSSLSTLSEDEARRREAEGHTVVRRVVPVETLASIWRAHVPAGREVQLLKVDVEGGEREVLEGLDWTTMQPWIVVVEATRPHNPEPTHERWESILLEAGYALVYRDGVNRFYLSAAHAELAPAFEFPPNYWDRYVTAAQRNAERRALEAHARLAALRASASWRMTRPLRALARRLRGRGGLPDD